jgi:squalene synthase HpnC
VTGFLFPAEFIARHGVNGRSWETSESLAYTRWLTHAHYENFPVVSLLLPRRLHQDFHNVYSFCRWADDLGDEIGEPQRSLELLAWWRGELDRMYAGKASHPVYVALSETIRRHSIPPKPFEDLIQAFVRDQTETRYRTYDALLGYCAYSANPVGRLVLRLCGYGDAERARLSDFTCTALQLANFWQDVGRDWEKGRVYIPFDAMEDAGYSFEELERDIQRGAPSPAFQDVLRGLVGRCEALFEKGLPLVDMVDRRLAVDLDLFSRGGMKILEKIRRQRFDVIAKRPKLSKWDHTTLLAAALARQSLRLGRVNREARHAYR